MTEKADKKLLAAISANNLVAADTTSVAKSDTTIDSKADEDQHVSQQ